MELEEAIQTLKDFAKYGRYYSNNTEHHMKTAINTVLNELDVLKFKYQARKDRTDTIIKKQEKMIELMSKHIRADDIDEDICQYQGICNEYECEECIKQYFEKKEGK